MTRFVIGLILLFGLLTALTAGARALALRTATTPAYLTTGETCAQPCWQGIQPGVSTRDAFMRRVQEINLFGGRSSDYGTEIISMFELSTYGVITLADVLLELGPPERVGCLALDHSAMTPGVRAVTAVSLYYAGGVVEVNAVRGDTKSILTPDMQIRTIRYFAPGEPAYEIGMTTEWQGFTGTSHYRACR